MGLRILYIGQDDGGSYLRADALKRLGHTVDLINPFFLSGFPGRLLGKWMYETGGLGVENYVRNLLLSKIGSQVYDIAHVDGGSMVGPRLVQELKQQCGTVINYNCDDPFGMRDRNNWRLYLQAVPYYDLLVVVREVNVAEAYALGAKSVVRVFRPANEFAHAPRSLSASDWAKWGSDIVFVGTWMPERGPFLAQLVSEGLPLTIYGNGWNKSSEWATLKQAWKGGGIFGDDYAKAIQCAQICLGLLSKGNRDLHTIRTAEIPFLGGLFCAERTIEHLQLYTEDSEAIFWSDADECIRKCRDLLGAPERRRRIAENGRKRAIKNGLLDQPLMEMILRQALGK